MTQRKQSKPARRPAASPAAKEHHGRERTSFEERIDEEERESFPASDPPSHSGGIAGSPAHHDDGREGPRRR